MHITIIMKKETLNLKESKNGSTEWFGGGKGRRKLWNYIIITNNNEREQGVLGVNGPDFY